MLTASIPSPSSPYLTIGPLSVHWYGIFIAAAVVLAVIITKRRFAARGGKKEVVDEVALVAVLMGVIGARIWHVATQWGFYRSHPSEMFKVWGGGLAIFGALIGGAIGALAVLKYRKASVVDFADAVAPALPFAQAIGRLGNYFNQELYGKPSHLPWALRIDADNRIAPYGSATTFHPVFLYEALANLLLGTILLLLDRKQLVRRGVLLPFYITGYGLIRCLVEMLRIDRRYDPFGWTINGYISLGIFVLGLIWSIIAWKRGTAPIRNRATSHARGVDDLVHEMLFRDEKSQTSLP
jgi:prolipoprotein diacylglyceryl transferase